MKNNKIKVGDKVTVKSRKWYDKNKDNHGFIHYMGIFFSPQMKKHCGKTLIIEDVEQDCYRLENLPDLWWYDGWLKKKETKKKSKKKWFTPEEKMPEGKSSSVLVKLLNGDERLYYPEEVVKCQVYKWRYAPKFPKLPNLQDKE